MQNQEVEAISTEFTRLANAEIAEHSQRYFRTGPGEYGHGDVFLGLRVPMIRELAKKYKEISEKTILHFLRSKFHEHRLLALIVLTLQYKKGSEEKRESIFILYCKNRKYVNNWDLVDTSAPLIVGAHLIQRDRSVLLEWAKSKSIWDRRISILSTLAFIRQGDFGDTLAIAKMLLKDEEDLIHKAVGWMLREVGERDREPELAFLDRFASSMTRTMLRYAIEKLPEKQRQQYLKAGRS